MIAPEKDIRLSFSRRIKNSFSYCLKDLPCHPDYYLQGKGWILYLVQKIFLWRRDMNIKRQHFINYNETDSVLRLRWCLIENEYVV